MPASQSPQVIGPYRTLAALSDRGFGPEYLAVRGGAGAAAIRLLVLEGVKPPLQKRLKQRMREAVGLRDPRLERVLELSDARGTQLLATECVLGVTLHELLQSSAEAPDPALLAGIVAQAARGLHALHEHRDRREAALEWVHGHLSPNSVLIAWSGRVVVTQIALAELAAARVTGHFKYFSPEQARAGALDRRSDVFSLGLLLYEALTKTHPFSTESLPDYMLSVLADSPRDPCQLDAALPPELASVVMRCIERDKERRFSDCRELADALLACPGVEAAAEESNLSAMLAERYAAEREASEKLLARANALQDVSDPRLAERSSGRGRVRTLLVLVMLAIAAAILAWVAIGRAAPTC